jgi:hypothetical protein
MNKIHASPKFTFARKTNARWDEQTTEQLPAYLKALFINILNTTNKIVEELKLTKNKHADFIKRLVMNSKRSH